MKITVEIDSYAHGSFTVGMEAVIDGVVGEIKKIVWDGECPACGDEEHQSYAGVRDAMSPHDFLTLCTGRKPYAGEYKEYRTDYDGDTSVISRDHVRKRCRKNHYGQIALHIFSEAKKVLDRDPTAEDGFYIVGDDLTVFTDSTNGVYKCGYTSSIKLCRYGVRI